MLDLVTGKLSTAGEIRAREFEKIRTRMTEQVARDIVATLDKDKQQNSSRNNREQRTYVHQRISTTNPEPELSTNDMEVQNNSGVDYDAAEEEVVDDQSSTQTSQDKPWNVSETLPLSIFVNGGCRVRISVRERLESTGLESTIPKSSSMKSLSKELTCELSSLRHSLVISST